MASGLLTLFLVTVWLFISPCTGNTISNTAGIFQRTDTKPYHILAPFIPPLKCYSYDLQTAGLPRLLPFLLHNGTCVNRLPDDKRFLWNLKFFETKKNSLHRGIGDKFLLFCLWFNQHNWKAVVASLWWIFHASQITASIQSRLDWNLSYSFSDFFTKMCTSRDDWSDLWENKLLVSCKGFDCNIERHKQP